MEGRARLARIRARRGPAQRSGHRSSAFPSIARASETASAADSLRMDADECSAQVPAGKDVTAEIYQFDLFEQNASDGADSQDSDEIKRIATAHADAATKRDTTLKAIQERIGSDAKLDKSMWGRASLALDL